MTKEFSASTAIAIKNAEPRLSLRAMRRLGPDPTKSVRATMVKAGFSLIELLMVLVIIGVLAVISYPSYQNYIVRAHRSDGQLALLDLACRMEMYYAEHNTYKTATIGTGKPTDVLSQRQSLEGWYTLSFTQITNTAYTLQATPNTPDPRCQSLTLTSSGVKGITAIATGVSQCW